MDDIDKGTLVQQRIKKMLQNKKKTQLRETGDSTKRLKSGNGDKNFKEDEEEIVKPQSGMRMRRPVSAFKAAESTSITTTSPKIEIDIKAILVTTFNHGVKLAQFLKENRLDPNKYLEWLSNNELFILSTLGKLKEIPEQKHSSALQKQCIIKITRELKVRQQTKKCEQAQSRISRILDQRIRTLSKHSST